MDTYGSSNTRMLSAAAAKTVVHAFISLCLDYCNSLCSASLPICSSIFRPYKMLQHVLLLVPNIVSTSRPSWGNFIDCQCDSASNSSWQFWCTKHWMACLHNIWQTTASLNLYCRPTTTLIVHRRHVWSFKNSHKSGQSFIHCCRTASVEQPASPSTWPWTYIPAVSPVTENAPVLLRTAAPSGLFAFWAPYISAFTYTILIFNISRLGDRWIKRHISW